MEAKQLWQVKSYVTNVVLSPPPGADYWGERFAAVDLKDISKHTGDTIKISGKVTGYSVIDTTAFLILDSANVGQKLTVKLKGEAKQYLEAQIRMDAGSKSGLDYLKNKKIIAIVLVSANNEIILTNPNSFIITD